MEYIKKVLTLSLIMTFRVPIFGKYDLGVTQILNDEYPFRSGTKEIIHLKEDNLPKSSENNPGSK